jgi:glycine/D-amino acid oxidase-like deaminating enzyme
VEEWQKSMPHLLAEAARFSQTGRHVAVVGGGVVGCACAFELARCGARVTLFEPDGIASHASGHNAGNLNPLYATPERLKPLALAAFARHAHIREALGACGIEVTAAPVERLLLGASDAERHALEATAAAFNGTPGFSAQWLGCQDLHRLEPRLSGEIGFGVLTTGNLSLDAADFSRALATGAKLHGATIVPARVTGVEARGRAVTGIRAGDILVACDAAVVAAGAFAAGLPSWLGAHPGVEPLKGELLILRLRGGAPAFDLTWGDTCFYRRRGAEVWLGGTTTQAGLDATPSAGARADLLARAARLLPCAAQADVLDHVAGLRPLSASGLPIAQAAPDWENVWLANGGGFKGVLLSVEIARQIGELVLGAASGRSAAA